MKYLVSIIMVLLMANFFAQAQTETKDESVPNSPTEGLAISTKDIKRDPAEIDGAMAKTMAIDAPVASTEATRNKRGTATCPDSRGRCDNTTQGRAPDKKRGAGVAKTGDGKMVDPSKVSKGEATK